MSAKIKIRIDRSGDTHFEVQGIEGPNCELLTEALVRATGDEVDKQFTEEYQLDLPDFLEQHEEE